MSRDSVWLNVIEIKELDKFVNCKYDARRLVDGLEASIHARNECHRHPGNGHHHHPTHCTSSLSAEDE